MPLGRRRSRVVGDMDETSTQSQPHPEPGGRDRVIIRRPSVDETLQPQPFKSQEAPSLTDLVVGRPTVAANGGAGIPRKLQRAFDAADVSSAEWVRLPAPRSRCRITNLSRTSINEAIDRGDVRAITVRQPGATRGIKLVNRRSLLDWLTRLEAEQNPQRLEGGDR